MNGYTNWDTWALLLWLDSTELSYFTVRNNKDFFLALEDKRLFNYITSMSRCTDDINPLKVNFEEVRQAIQEM